MVTTLGGLVEWRADAHACRLGFAFLPTGEQASESLTYGELAGRARAVGAALRDRGAFGERVLLVYPPGLDFIVSFLGCMYAGATAVPMPAVRSHLKARFEAVVQDARPRWALTTSAMLPALRSHLEAPACAGLEVLDAAAFAGETEPPWRGPRVSADQLALLQYTSGSTAAPKGVMLTHANLLQNQRMIQERYGETTDSVVVTWLPMFHDMGLIGTVLQPLYVGYPAFLMPPEAFLQEPRRWLAAISRLRATTSGGPNFAYDLCVDRIPPGERSEIDLSSWEVAFVGSEPVRSATLDRFERAFAPCGFRRRAFFPCYGLAEATLFAAGGRRSEPPTVCEMPREGAGDEPGGDGSGAPGPLAVGCGTNALGTRLLIVDPETCQALPEGQAGEIWIAGPTVAQGYWRQPEATQAVFQGHLAETGEGPFLRTGDLGMMRDGELFITGRLKEVMIVRGRKHHPHDIERTAEQAHPALRTGSSSAFLVGNGAQERLVLALEVRREHIRSVPTQEVARGVRAAIVREHGLHAAGVVLLRTGSIPKTSSGKIRRNACREGFLAGTLAVVAEDHHGSTSRSGGDPRPLGTAPALVPGETPSVAEETQ